MGNVLDTYTWRLAVCMVAAAALSHCAAEPAVRQPGPSQSCRGACDADGEEDDAGGPSDTMPDEDSTSKDPDDKNETGSPGSQYPPPEPVDDDGPVDVECERPPGWQVNQCLPKRGAPGDPELPRVHVALPPGNPQGMVRAVPAGGDLQAALNSASAGDIIELQAGAHYTGNFVLPAKSAGGAWITIRSSAYQELPPRGQRIGPQHQAYMPKIVSPNTSPALRTAAAAHHYRLEGIEITTTYASRASTLQNLILLEAPSQTSLAVVPHHLVFERCYVHGTSTGNIRRGFALNSAHTAIVDSYVSDFHEVGRDSQGIAGWNGPGPFRIENNYLEGAAENFLLGGADPGVYGLVPADIVFRRNYLSKPLSWRIGDPQYGGIPWSVKNLFELKNSRRVLVDGNVMENNWPHDQDGFAILFTVRNQDGGSPWSVVEDVTFSNNILRNVAQGINILVVDNNYPSARSERMLIHNNLILLNANYGGGRMLQHLTPSAPGVNFKFEHNTALMLGGGHTLLEMGFCCNVVWQDYIFKHNIVSVGQRGAIGRGLADGLPALNGYLQNYAFDDNIFVGPSTVPWPGDNLTVPTLDEVGFRNPGIGDFALLPNSPYACSARDGSERGVYLPMLRAAQECQTAD